MPFRSICLEDPTFHTDEDKGKSVDYVILSYSNEQTAVNVSSGSQQILLNQTLDKKLPRKIQGSLENETVNRANANFSGDSKMSFLFQRYGCQVLINSVQLILM